MPSLPSLGPHLSKAPAFGTQTTQTTDPWEPVPADASRRAKRHRALPVVLTLAALLCTSSLTVTQPAQALNLSAQPASAAAQPADEDEAKSKDRKKNSGKRKGKKSRSAAGDEEKPQYALTSKTLSGLKFRELGPALPSGRIVDFAVDPERPKRYFAAAASGGLWLTENAGTTWKPVFDQQKSYSIGAITLDPTDSLTLWVGTGENNSQRSVAYGDGVYKSIDGGETFKNVGLAESEHIGMIAVDPRDTEVVYVAAQGPLWRAGGERGLYKTTDGGGSWQRILEIDEHTGVSEVLLDPRDPEVLYAVSYQRARRVWTLINGGPGSGIHKSTDGGKTWRKVHKGLPGGDLGRIGLAQAPSRPNRLYAVVEAREGGGLYRSDNGGESWSKQSSYTSGSPQYYQELFVDPHDADRVYSMDTLLMVSVDGGENWTPAGEEFKHVDNHALWIDPADTEHLLVGTDGGIYESFDQAKTWSFKANLPLAQFYKIALDNDLPFYNVYGGTQDNNTLGGPVATTHRYGISNREWFTTLGGDGFQPAVDPTNPDIVYSEWQHGNLSRYDRKTGERLDIKPRAEAGDDPLRWHWDSPLLISPHNPTRLYFAAQRVFLSPDRGDSWQPISGDLTRQLDRDQLEIMGRVWPIDAVAKNASTSLYGSLVALDESPRVEGLLYVGSDDGLVQRLEPNSGTWRDVTPPAGTAGLSKLAYVADVVASRHVDDRVFVVYNNHKEGDFAPYILRSDDRGQSWQPIHSDLPPRGSTWVLAEDPVRQDLLYVGTEFGVFVSFEGGARWIQLEGGLPTIAVRDLKLHEREHDLVLGTFGRGFWVLDDITPLRHLDEKLLAELKDFTQEDGSAAASTQQAEPSDDSPTTPRGLLLPVQTAKLFFQSDPLSGPGKAFLGHGFYTAENPPRGAVFTHYLNEVPKTLSQQRKAAEKKALEEGTPVAIPTLEELRREAEEEKPKFVFIISSGDAGEGETVRRLEAPARAGVQRTVWDLRYAATNPISLSGGQRRFGGPPRGPRVAPGRYSVRLVLEHAGQTTPLGELQTFTAEPLHGGTLTTADRQALEAFQLKTARLQRAVLGGGRSLAEAERRVEHLLKAAETTALPESARTDLEQAERALADLSTQLQGDRLAARRYRPVGPSITGRVQTIVRGHWSSTSPVTATHQRSYELAAEAFAPWLERLRKVVSEDLPRIEAAFDEAGAPWTPGRLPTWRPE